VHRFLSPTALALAAVGLVLMGGMVWLGLWQLSVYDDHQHAEALAALRKPEVPLGSLLGPDDAFPSDGVGRPVRVAGTYLAGSQVYVRHLPGSEQRYAVATPLVTATGSAIMVVRGSSPLPDAPVPPGRVAVTGFLEPVTASRGTPDSSGVMAALSIAGLVNRVRPDLYSGYVLLRSSVPQQSADLTPVGPPLPDPSRWSGLRNLLYACQWWVFALFVAFMWWRMTENREPEEALNT
jgi:surfeit locus 1 family protein